MRIKDDCSYSEYKEDVEGAFHLFEEDGWSAENVTNYLAHEDWSDDMDDTTSGFMWFLSIAVMEIELDILEERVLVELSYYMPMYDNGVFDDLTPEEKELVEKDVQFVKKRVKLIPRDQLKLA